MTLVNVGIIGVGNCASALVQGVLFATEIRVHPQAGTILGTRKAPRP